MSKPDKKFGHLSAWGFWSIRSQPNRGPAPCLTALRKTKVLCKLKCPRAWVWSCVDASRRKRKRKKEKKTFCFSQQKPNIENKDFLKERAPGKWWGPGYGLTLFADFLPELRTQFWLGCIHIQQSRMWISKCTTLMNLSPCLISDLERLKTFSFFFFHFLFWRGVE